ncbi:complex I NDUFA9 subunit family protein [Undibacterium arcticum]
MVLVIGGTGFIGSHIVAQLAAAGVSIVVPTRHYERARHLLELPTVDLVQADVHDAAALHQLMQDVDAVINLVGILHSRPGVPYGPDFAAAHVALPTKIVAACAATGVTRYLHMSALGGRRSRPLRCTCAPRPMARPRPFSRPEVKTTVFRPSVVFGAEDHFLNMFAAMQKKWFPVIPLGAADAKFQPIHVEDVARAYVHALDNPRTIGQVYELAGPKVYTLRKLVQLAGQYSGHARPVIALPSTLARWQAWLLEHAPGEPLMTRDNLDSMRCDNVASGPIAAELDIQPAALEAVAPHYLAGRDQSGRLDAYRRNAKR